MANKINKTELESFVSEAFDSSIIPTLKEYITIPNQSPSFDKEWETNGLIDKVVDLFVKWIREQEVPGLTYEVVKEQGRTPIIYMEVPATTNENTGTILLYGHMDKQPPFQGWDEGLGPYTPVIRDGKLYGRGGADDGYAMFSSITALKALKKQGIPHSRCVIIIEACEESGSYDLPYYIDKLSDRIGTPELVICLDSGAGNYEQLWMTTSLRGMAMGTLRVKILKEGVHSGDGSGIVPSTFRIVRQLLSRIEDEKTGEILLPELHVPIPQQRLDQAKIVAEVLGDQVHSKFPFHDGVKPVQHQDVSELILNRTWKPALEVTGADGIPPVAAAGNVMRPETAVKLSMRLPPRVKGEDAKNALKRVLEENPPYNAVVSFENTHAMSGWDSNPIVPWLEKSVDAASRAFYNGKPPCYMGEGGSIPFMGMLGLRFPDAQFLITGVLGPNSNAHGPNEFLHIDYTKRLTCCVACVLADHAAKSQQQ